MYVYRPPKYAGKSEWHYHAFGHTFCKECMLRPCMTQEFYPELYELGDHKMKNSTNADIQEAVARKGMTLLEPHLGKRYVKKMTVPKCLLNFAKESWPESDSESEEERDGEEEETFEDAVEQQSVGSL